MAKKKGYKITAKNVEYLISQYINADSAEEAKSIFKQDFENGQIGVGGSEVQFQEVTIVRR